MAEFELKSQVKSNFDCMQEMFVFKRKEICGRASYLRNPQDLS